jgi:hypothetical protein
MAGDLLIMVSQIHLSPQKKQSSASCGPQTTGSFSLNEVRSTIGTPVKSLGSIL